MTALSFPILNREIRTLLRTRKAFIFLMLLLLLAAAALLIFWSTSIISLSYGQRSGIARQAFSSIITTLLVGLGLISPLLTATAISSEREARTLELLFCSGLSRFQIIFGKWFSAITYQLLLCICALPVFALVFHLGGVASGDLIRSFTLLLMTVATYGMVGLACSTLFQRSIPAIVMTLILILFFAVGFVVFQDPSNRPNVFFVSPIFTMTSAVSARGSYSVFAQHLAFQTALFCSTALLAWVRLARRETLRAIIAKPLIDNPETLARRRNEWPYYLIDPLARAQHIRDNQSPMYIKEIRVGSLSKLHVLIRLSYIGFAVSVILMVLIMLENQQAFAAIGCWVLGFIILFMPVVSSSLISRERQEGTLALLTQTLLTPWQIVRAKFRVTLRYIGILTASLLLLPVIVYTGIVLRYHQGFDGFLNLIEVIWGAAVCAMFYSALGLFCSSRCKSNAAALVLNYAFIALLTLISFFLKFLWSFLLLIQGRRWTGSQEGGLETLALILNPFIWFTQQSSFKELLCAQAILLALSAGLLWATTHHLTADRRIRWRRASALLAISLLCDAMQNNMLC